MIIEQLEKYTIPHNNPIIKTIKLTHYVDCEDGKHYYVAKDKYSQFWAYHYYNSICFNGNCEPLFDTEINNFIKKKKHTPKESFKNKVIIRIVKFLTKKMA